jgi:hypothetical protein
VPPLADPEPAVAAWRGAPAGYFEPTARRWLGEIAYFAAGVQAGWGTAHGRRAPPGKPERLAWPHTCTLDRRGAAELPPRFSPSGRVVRNGGAPAVTLSEVKGDIRGLSEEAPHGAPGRFRRPFHSYARRLPRRRDQPRRNGSGPRPAAPGPTRAATPAPPAAAAAWRWVDDHLPRGPHPRPEPSLDACELEQCRRPDSVPAEGWCVPRGLGRCAIR